MCGIGRSMSLTYVVTGPGIATTMDQSWYPFSPLSHWPTSQTISKQQHLSSPLRPRSSPTVLIIYRIHTTTGLGGVISTSFKVCMVVLMTGLRSVLFPKYVIHSDHRSPRQQVCSFMDHMTSLPTNPAKKTRHGKQGIWRCQTVHLARVCRRNGQARSVWSVIPRTFGSSTGKAMIESPRSHRVSWILGVNSSI